MAQLELVHGNGDLIQVLERALARAKNGELLTVVVAMATEDEISIDWGARGGVPHSISMMLASLDAAKNTVKELW